jgi:hypothetical protein
MHRSSSVGPGMTASDLNPTDRNRRALYAELPFISIYGMQYREQSIAKSLSRVNLADMGAHGEEPSLSDIDLDEVSHCAASSDKQYVCICCVTPVLCAVLSDNAVVHSK